jgi:hypothetical protein
VRFFTQGEAHTRSFIKAVSWRVTGSIDTFVISLFVTGKFGVAGAIRLGGGRHENRPLLFS